MDKKKKPIGKIKCEVLKDMRREIARRNNIPYEPAECHHEGDCPGTCPQCDMEMLELLRHIRNKKAKGEKIQLENICLLHSKLANRDNIDCDPSIDMSDEEYEKEFGHPRSPRKTTEQQVDECLLSQKEMLKDEFEDGFIEGVDPLDDNSIIPDEEDLMGDVITAGIPSKLFHAFPGDEPGIPPHDEEVPALDCIVAGTTYAKGIHAITPLLKEGTALLLKRVHDNKYDEKAVEVWFKDLRVGFLPREKNEVIANLMDAGKRFIARIIEAKWVEGMDDWLRLSINVLMLEGIAEDEDEDENDEEEDYDEEDYENENENEEDIDDDEEDEQENENFIRVPTGESREYDLTAFNTKLLSQLYSESDNIAYSPYRLSMVLALLSNFGTDEARKEIQHTLFEKEIDLQKINECFSKELHQLRDCKQPEIVTATTLWTDKRLSLDEALCNRVSQYYSLDKKELDFKSARAKGIIQRHIAKFTQGKIQKMELDINSLTRLILTDTLYFNATWLSIFDSTWENVFNTKEGEVNVQVIHQCSYLPYQETDLCQSVVLLYESKENKLFSMVVHLPKEGHSVQELISTNGLAKMDRYKIKHVSFSMPQFSIAKRYLLIDILESLNIKRVFTEEGLSKLCQDVAINQIIQQIKLDVTQKGTEAGIVTEADCVETGVPNFSKIIDMDVNRPFVFEIKSLDMQITLFAGVVNDPSK